MGLTKQEPLDSSMSNLQIPLTGSHCGVWDWELSPVGTVGYFDKRGESSERL